MNEQQLHEYGILAAIQDLHMNINGSSDTLPIVKGQYCGKNFTQEEVYKALVIRFDNWKNSNKCSTYDITVKRLLLEVLCEYEKTLSASNKV